MTASIILASINFAAVCALAALGAASYRGDLASRVVVGFLLFWGSLAFTAYLLASVSLLGRPIPYFVVSILVAALGAFLMRRGREAPASRPPKVFSPVGSLGERVLVTAALVIIVSAILGTTLLVVFYDPNNFDTLAYRYPRAMLYLSQGHLGHFYFRLPNFSYDPRLTFYPLGTVFLLFLPGTYGLDGRLFNLAGYGCWLFGGVAVFAFARALGTSRRAAIISTALYMTAPAVLVSASSTNDDMIAGVPAVMAALFAWRWWWSRRIVDMGLAGLALGLSFGSKLHGLFLYPLVGAVVILVLARPFMRREAVRRLVEHRTHLLVGALLAGAIALPPLVINWLQTRQVFAQFVGISNSPFSVVAAVSNVTLNTAQLLFGDLPYLPFFPTAEDRLRFLARFNAFFNEYVFWWVSDSLGYRHLPSYKFRGVADPDPGLGAWEQSVHLGLIPWLLIVTLIVAFLLRAKRVGALIAFWLAACVLVRHVGYNAHIRYAEAVGIYHAYAMGLAAPALAWVWDARIDLARRWSIAVVAATVMALAGNALIGVDSFISNHQRNIPELVRYGFSTKPRDVLSPDLTATLARLERIHFVYARWELELFSYMLKNMRARFSISQVPRFEPGVTNLFSYDGTDLKTLTTMRLDAPSPHRLTLIGSFLGGGPVVFTSGALPESVDHRRIGHVLMRPVFLWDKAGAGARATTVAVAVVIGIGDREPLETRVMQVLPDGERRPLSDWQELARLTRTRYPLAEPCSDGAIEVRFRLTGDPAQEWVGTIPINPGILVDPSENARLIENTTIIDSLNAALREYNSPKDPAGAAGPK